MSRFSRVAHFFVSGAEPQVNEDGVDRAESCDCGHETGILCKKGLAFTQNKPTLRIPPRPDPGSSGPPAAGSPSTPAVSGPPLSFRSLLQNCLRAIDCVRTRLHRLRKNSSRAGRSVRARLQSCRKWREMRGALAPEGSLCSIWSFSKTSLAGEAARPAWLYAPSLNRFFDSRVGEHKSQLEP